MKYINLTKGYRAKVDDEWFGRLSIHHWCCVIGAGRKPYAVRARKLMDGPGSSLIYMHRVIAGATDGQQADHKNGITMDCRSPNLRVATPSQNMHNMRPYKTRSGRRLSSKYKGVSRVRKGPLGRPWKVQIGINGTNLQVGRFANEEDAARAYNRAAVKQYGSFARLNEVPA